MDYVKRIYIAHTINTIASSIISIYVPAYLLIHGYPLWRVMIFFIINHSFGLLFALFFFPIFVKKWGLLQTFKLYYPLQILFLLFLSTMNQYHMWPELIAAIGGVSVFAYWMSMNIFIIKYSHKEDIGGNLSKFFALPQAFGIIGPLIGAVLIPPLGFWPVFLITILGLLASYIPLSGVSDKDVVIDYNLSRVGQRLMKNKLLFVFELLDNIIEESQWFWSVYVFLVIGSLTEPGIVGSLQAIGGALFTFFIGKHVNRQSKKLIPIASILLLVVTAVQMVVRSALSAYVITVVASLLLTLFLVAYFSSVYKTVKNDKEEEFMIVREIPTVLGRMIVFGCVFLTLHNLRYFFVLPIVTIGLLLGLYIWRGKTTFITEDLEVALSAE